MATARLVASSYAISQYITVTNESNMYTNVDSDTYATAQNTNNSTTVRYLYIRGFNFTSIPANAIINSFAVKIKGYEKSLSTSSSYAPRLSHGTTDISGTTASSAFNTSSATITIPTGSLSWSDITDYGTDFTVTLPVRRSSKNTVGYAYIQGVEIAVDYTVPVYHTVTSSTDSGTISPSGATTVAEGDSYTLTISGVSSPHVTDNGTDVTSQLVQASSGTTTLVPNGNTSSGFSVSDISNAYTDATSSTYATLQLNGQTSGTIYLDIANLNLPSGSTISSVSCSAKLGYNSGGSGSSFSASCQMYAGSTAKGSSTTVVSSASTDISSETLNLSVGSWSASDVDNARFYLTATNGASSTKRYLYIFGVSFTVTYTISGVIYTYTISSVMADHTIVVTESAVQTDKLYFKSSGAWVQATKAYKKVNGAWVEQSNLSTVFDSNTHYVKGN